MKKALLPVACLATAFALVACGSSDEEDTHDADAVEASASSAQSSHFDEMLFSNVFSTDPATAVAQLTSATAMWWPAGCVTREKDASDPHVVHVHLQDCTGPFGLRKHTGDITVVLSKNADGTLHADLTSTNMTVNGKAVSMTGTRDVAIEGETRIVKGNRTWTRENDEGETVKHQTTATVVVDRTTKCRTVQGEGSTFVGDREVRSSVGDLKICRRDAGDGCPTGTITHQNLKNGKTVTVTFDGTAVALRRGPKGDVRVPLVCIP